MSTKRAPNLMLGWRTQADTPGVMVDRAKVWNAAEIVERKSATGR